MKKIKKINDGVKFTIIAVVLIAIFCIAITPVTLQNDTYYTIKIGEHIQNNSSVRDMLGQRGIKPEDLPPSEDIKRLERRVRVQEKKMAQRAEQLPKIHNNENGQ